MRYLKIYENYQTEAEVAKICKKYGIKNWSINSDGLVDVDGDVDLFKRSLKKLPLKFGKVTGDFCCNGNQLTTLEGAPETVGGDFWCQYNKLTTLEGAPQSVSGSFNCSYNQLTTLEGAPEAVGGGFYCHNNQLTTLEGAPETVGGGFYCNSNKLTTLEGAPYSVSGFDCEGNKRLNTLITKNLKHIKHIIANQYWYKIYNADGSINEYRFQLMMDSMD